MDPERSARLVELFQRVVELPAEERQALLDSECAGDAQMRERLERLLRDDGAPSSILDDFDGRRELERSDPMVGQELGPYLLTAVIARGGMGVVYRGVRTDGVFDRNVAVKLIRSDEATAAALLRFERERQALALLDHENIARLYDGGTSKDGRPYFVMEYVEGLPVDEYCDQHRLDVAARLRLFVPICHAVQFAHQHLIVHRDLKPSNVLVDQRGMPKLLDFGIAHIFESDQQENARRTRTQTRLLTPEYASPEQMAGAPVTTATDVYSLGVILYALLTGRRPFRLTTSSPIEWERQIAERSPTRPSSQVLRVPAEQDGGGPSPEEFARRRETTPARLRRRLSGDLDRIVLMALRKEPERRYHSPAELADDVERHLDGRAVHARDDSFAYVLSRFARRNRVAVAAVLAVFAALVIGLAAARRAERHAREQALHARIEATSFQRISDFLTNAFLHTSLFRNDEQRRRAVDDVRNFAENVRVEFAADAHLQANLLDELGQICMRLGLLDDGEGFVLEALDLRLDTFGRRNLEVALSLNSLGQIHLQRGEFETAVDYLSEALELHRACPVGTHTDVASAANDLAVALRNAGDTTEAERLHREALALRRATENSSTAVAESLNNLAGILMARGEFAAAKEALSEALAIRRKVLGEAALATGHSWSNLAQALWGLGDKDGARAHLEHAVEVFRHLRSHGHDDLGTALSNLATLDIGQGNLAEAEIRLAEALRIQQDQHGPDHPDVADTLRNLAGLQRQQGRGEDARASLEEVLRIRRVSLSDTSPLLGRTLQEYGTALMGMEAMDEAAAALTESVEILSAPPVSNELWLARAELTLGRCRLRKGEEDEGQLLIRRGAERLQSSGVATAPELEMMRGLLRQIGDTAQEAAPATGH